MTYGELRDAVLRLINQYSAAGEKVAATYNNQADYLARIPDLVNDALLYIATTARRLRAAAEPALTEQKGSWNVYRMPDDFWQLCTGGVYSTDERGNLYRENRFLLLGGRRIALPAEPARQWTVEYFRYPAKLPAEPADELALDCPEEAATAAAYYVAAHLVLQDDQYAQAPLYNEFETKLSRLGELPAAERDTVTDVYPDWGDIG